MPGGQTTNQNQQQQQQQNTQPWAPTQGMLYNLLGKLGGLNTDVTQQQKDALGNLSQSAGGLQNFGGQAGDLANQLFGYNNDAQRKLLTGGNDAYQKTLSPYLSSSYLNPYSTPGFSDALKTMNTDITNQVNDQYAAAGRDLSPGNSTYLSRGLSQGEGGLLANQYNQNVQAQQAAAAAGYGANQATAQGLSGLDQLMMGMRSGGLGVAGAVPGLSMAPGMAQMSVANMGAQMPYQNLGWLEQSLLPISALGSQSQGTNNTNTQTQQQTNPISNILGGAMGGLGLLGGTGGFGSNGWLSSLFSMFSDERLKTDIEPVGELYDNTPVYSYRYNGDPTPRIGLIAQDVEQRRPDAVTEIGGFKAVHYGKATANARVLGMLHHLDLA